MKNILLTLLALTSFCRVDARDYLPIFTEGKVWNLSFYEMVNGEIQKTEYQEYVAGDTIVDGKECKIILPRKLEGPLEYSITKQIVYESDKKVYSVYINPKPSPADFVLRIDFNLELGDEFAKDNPVATEYEHYYVSSVDSVMGGNVKRQRIKLSKQCVGSKGVVDCWIEGVGSTLGTWFIFTQVLPTCNNKANYIRRLVSCNDGDVCIYKSEVLPPIPSDFTGIESVLANRAPGNGKMYNLAGQQVGKNYNGVVIQNGRKFKR